MTWRYPNVVDGEERTNIERSWTLRAIVKEAAPSFTEAGRGRETARKKVVSCPLSTLSHCKVKTWFINNLGLFLTFKFQTTTWHWCAAQEVGLLPLVRQSGRGSALTGWDLEEEEEEERRVPSPCNENMTDMKGSSTAARSRCCTSQVKF